MNRFNKISIFILLFALAAFSKIEAQNIDTEHQSYPFAKKSLLVLNELLAIPNDANYPKDIEKNVVWCEEKLAAAGFSTKRLKTATVPLLAAEYNKKRKKKPTVLFYFHIDGQPVDPKFWNQPDPYQAVMKKEVEAEGWVDLEATLESLANPSTKEINPEWRIFARSSSDDKSPFVMFLAALKTIESEGKKLPYNLKIVLDFEEEKGSPNLAQAVAENKKVLASDMLIIYDGPKHLTNKPTIAFGARGITSMTIEVFGPTFPLHSGHYGNYAPNPALRLSKLLASMKDDQGRVTIPGYYDGIELTEKTKTILRSVPDNQKELMFKLGIGEIDSVGSNYQESIQYPSLNIRGMASAWVGKEKRTIVPATALAELDLRLVVESDGNRLRELVKEHIINQGYHIADSKPTSRERYLNKKICRLDMSRGVTKAFRTDFESDLGKWVFRSLKNTFGEDPVRLRTMGGTLPTSPFINTLNVPAVIVPLVNSDNNQHSPNENLRIGNYFDGVKTIYGLLNSAP